MLTNEMVLKIFADYLYVYLLKLYQPVTAMRSCFGIMRGRIGPR